MRDPASRNQSGAFRAGLGRRDFVRSAALAPLAASFRQSLPASPPPRIPYVDGLSFMPSRKADEIVGKSGLTAFILDVSSVSRIETDDGSIRYYRSFEACARSITAMRRRLRSMKNAFLATRGNEVDEAQRSGRSAVFFQFQGCEPLGEDLARLDMFYELGLRILQITHHNDNPMGGGALEAAPSGLTELGVQAVERMNDLGVVPDISHASDPTAVDVLKTSRKPVIHSHGAARSIVNNARCAPDNVIRAIGESGGVMGIFMMTCWLTPDPRPGIEHLIKQIRHVVRVAGIEAVGIANDYSIDGNQALAELGNDNSEGVKGIHPWWKSIGKQGVLGFDRLPEHVVVPELNDVRRMFTIHEALDQAGFPSAQVEKIMGGNWIRVLKESLG